MSALLNVQGLKSGYGVVEVLRGVDLQVMPGLQRAKSEHPRQRIGGEGMD